MCLACSKGEYDLVVTDRGNFIVITDPVAGSTVADRIVPGIDYITTITPIGFMRPADDYDAAILLARYGQGEEGCSAYVAPSYSVDEAWKNHDKALMLATTIDFEWMSVDKQHEILYGFSGSEGIPAAE
jgi:hypothetical protein